MSVKLNDSFTREFVKESEFEYIAPQAGSCSFSLLEVKKGPGSDFIGWLDLPVSYDRDEYARIKDVASRTFNVRCLCCQWHRRSYLEYTLAIEICKSHNYNALAKNTPKIYFAGNTISPSALVEHS